MDLAFLLFLPWVFWGVKGQWKGFREDYLSVSSGGALKGILAVLVVFHHLSRLLEGRFLFLLDNVGVLCVCLFFFLSGYGLEISYEKKPGYGKTILSRRIPSVLLPYLIFTLIYWAFEALMGTPMGLGQVLRSFVSGDPVAEFSWYLICILVFYVNFYLSTRLFPPGNWGMVGYHGISILLWVALCRALGYGCHWYNGAIAFPLGILWAMGERKLLPRLQKHYIPALLLSGGVFGVSFLGALYTAGETDVIVSLYYLAAGAFLLTVLLVLMKVSFRNRLLAFLGSISFEIYGIHGLFLRLYRSDFVYLGNDTLFCGGVIFSSVAAAWVLHRIFRKLLK